LNDTQIRGSLLVRIRRESSLLTPSPGNGVFDEGSHDMARIPDELLERIKAAGPLTRLAERRLSA
jgi:hypothetical protein